MAEIGCLTAWSMKQNTTLAWLLIIIQNAEAKWGICMFMGFPNAIPED